MEVIQNCIANILAALYQSLWFSVVLSVLFMFLKLYAEEHGWKNVFKQWFINFKTYSQFRRSFFLTLYTTMILFRTLLNRTMWANPVSNVIGVWGLYKENSAGERIFTTEILENLALFIPFTILLLACFREKILGEKVKIVKTVVQSVKITFIFSFTIEFLQLFLRLGTFQLSDLFFNTLGGLIGGGIYWIMYKIKLKGLKNGAKLYR